MTTPSNTVTEIAPDVFRISLYVPEAGMQFNQFLVRDEQPLLFHTNGRGLFPQARAAVASLIDPATLRWIGFSHFETDECGALNDWLALAPQAEPVCSFVGAIVSVNDFASRPAHVMHDGDTLVTGRRRFRFRATPHLPHGWDAGLLFEETERTLFTSDLFHHMGDPEPLTDGDILERVRGTLTAMQQSPLANYLPITGQTEGLLHGLAALAPRTLATMHGSSYTGDGARALRDLAVVMRETLGDSDAVAVAA